MKARTSQILKKTGSCFFLSIRPFANTNTQKQKNTYSYSSTTTSSRAFFASATWSPSWLSGFFGKATLFKVAVCGMRGWWKQKVGKKKEEASYRH